MSFGFIAHKQLSFQYLDMERTRWRLLQKRIVHTKFDIYIFIDVHYLVSLRQP